MKENKFKPHQSIKKIWYIEFIFLFILSYLIPLIPILYTKQILVAGIFSILILPWFLLALWWIPAFYNTITYSLKDDHIEINKGVWWQQNKTIPFSKITDVKAIQGPLQRYFILGSLYLQTAGMGAQNTAEGRLTGLTDHKERQQHLLSYIRKQKASIDQSTEPKQKVTASIQEPVLQEILKTLQNIEKQLKKK